MLLLALALAISPQASAQHAPGEVWSTVVEGKDFWPYESSRKRAIKYCKSYDFTSRHRDVRRVAKLNNADVLKAETLSIVPVEKSAGHWTAHYVGRVWLRKKREAGAATASRSVFERSIRCEVLREMLRQASPDQTATWAALAGGLGGARTRGFLKGLGPIEYASSYRQMLLTVQRAGEVLDESAKAAHSITDAKVDQLLADIAHAKSTAWSNYWRSGSAASLPNPPAFAQSSASGTVSEFATKDSLLTAGTSIAWRKVDSPEGLKIRFGMNRTGPFSDCLLRLNIQDDEVRAARVKIVVVWQHPQREKTSTTSIVAHVARGGELIIRTRPPSPGMRATSVGARRARD